MEQAGTHRNRLDAGSRGRRPVWALIVAGSLALTFAASIVLARPWENDPRLVLAASQRPATLRSVSVDLDVVTDPTTDWAALDRHLDEVGATAVYLNAGRVEFTAFDWAAHPDAAAAPGTDHLARAARELRTAADGTEREIGLIVDAFVPEWIKRDPAVAGIAPDGTLARYRVSAAQLAHGEVGDRLVEYVRDLGERYQPNEIAVTELFLDTFSFGDDDLALFRTMTGEADWPRHEDGTPDDTSPVVGAWRSEVIAGLLERMRTALDEVRDGRGTTIDLAMDVRIDWDDPARGLTVAGHDYDTMLRAADRLVLWAYLSGARPPSDIGRVSAALAAAEIDPARLTLSIGLWDRSPDDPTRRLSTDVLSAALEQAETHGLTHVDVTPISLMTDADWAALARAWSDSA